MQQAEFGERQADVLLKGGQVLNVYSGELLEQNVAVQGERILYVGPKKDLAGDKTLVLEAGGKVLVPGYVEPHCHPWNIYNPVTFGEEACRLGTTTLVCDNLIFYMLMGVERFEAFMETLSLMPVKFFWFVRAVPQTPMEGEEGLFSRPNLERLLKNPLVQSLGEITRWKELVKGNREILHAIAVARSLRKRVDGHTAGAKYENLNVISRAGVESCHESITGREVLDRLRLGLHVMLRESSLRQDLRDLLKVIREQPLAADRAMLTTDSSTPAFHREFGVTDHLIRVAMEEGIDPLLAYRLVTLNPAAYFGLDGQIGGIAPGRYADILLLKDLHHPTPEVVLSKGRVVSKNGALLSPFPKPDWKLFLPAGSLFEGGWRATEGVFQIRSGGNGCAGSMRFPVIKLVSSVITRVEWADFPVKDGGVDVPAREGLCLAAVLNRHGKWVANGILQGFSDRIEGIASSFTTATEILVIGRRREAMKAAVNRLLEIKGGIVAVEGGRAAYELPLPLGGMMSEKPIQELAEKERELKEFLSDRGYPYHDPLYTFIFLSNDFLPDVRINRKGVIDIRKDEILWPSRLLPPAT